MYSPPKDVNKIENQSLQNVKKLDERVPVTIYQLVYLFSCVL